MRVSFGLGKSVSFSVETPPLGHLSFGAVESDFIWEGCKPFRIRAIHRAVLYVSSCALRHYLINITHCQPSTAV
ncbi:hypothetical protein COH34_08230 [Neisseria meningitidis]|nr:hypothetical protein COI36_03145 [Neisseria meningitidis]RNK25474.1 hypothetical protein COH91_03040 [Neisseria meningitidis]RNK37320.1 hypothetical protein COH88_04790 [Neisseria meningitidis]RNL15457.1 hypothetical protein COH85_06210 [Neisseria meningitidis]RQJ67906.1 hypothetical protein COI15_01230 [Neisseria meningitidis]